MPPKRARITPAGPAPDWPSQARARVAANDYAGALEAWQAALAEAPDSLDVAAGLADTAFRLNLWDLAEKLYAHLITHGIQDAAVLNAYAGCLREQNRFDEAIDLLKSVLAQRPQEASLWEGLGSVLLAKGDRDTACIFLDEALRLEPGNLSALFHRGCARIELGQVRQGMADVADCGRRFADPTNRCSAQVTFAQAALSLGDLTAGWAAYDARHRLGTPREVHYNLALPRISGDDARGKRLFVSTEQGLGDEVLFASLLPDLAAETAHLGFGVEPRLVPLFQRSFPDATVVAHHTETRDGRIVRTFPGLEQRDFDAWALIGDSLASRRATLGDFPGVPYLIPDPERVVYWQRALARLAPGPKAGLLWKSLKSSHVRDQSFSPFEQWRPVLAQPGITFVNLQYGDTAYEMAQAKAAGLTVHTIDGIDLKDDLDDLSALSLAMDVIIGPSNATTNIAAACGATVWMVTPPRPWLALGQDRYPWYASVRLFASENAGDWAPVMSRVAEALSELAPKSTAD